MKKKEPALARLDTELGEVLNRVRRIREMDLSTEQERGQAIEESRYILGAMARYRRWLDEIECEPAPERRAA